MNNVLGLGIKGIVVAMTLIAVALVGLQYALAQTGETEATSTPPTEVVVTETSTSTETTSSDTAASEEAANNANGTETPAAEVVTEAQNQEANLPDQAAIAAKNAAIGEIKTLEDVYYRKHGKYLQILKGNGLPDYESGTVTEKLGKGVDSKAYVHVYESADGKGYQVFYEDGDMLYSVGFGPEAADRTFERSTALPTSATSTQAVIQ